jgi:hypothetical protein
MIASGFTAPQDQIGFTNSILKTASNQIMTIEKTNKTANNSWSNKALNFNFHNISASMENSINLDYLHYDFSGNQQVFGNSYNSSEELINSNRIRNIVPLIIDVYSGKY